MAKKYKCPYCNDRYIRKDLIDHIDNEHEELIPDCSESAQIVYDVVNNTKGAGRCRVCSKATKWNSNAKRYDVLCENPRCKQHMREEYQKNMLRVHGTYNILTSDEQQKKMLANRSISGKYKFTDGGVVTYTGSYEKKFLEFTDKVMQIPSKDIMAPGPTIEYEMNGKKHFYITDFLYIPYNLIIEVKDGGSNPNNKNTPGMKSSRQRTIEKEKLITDRGEYNYLRLTDNQFVQLLEIFMDIKKALIEGDDGKIVRINESSEDNVKELIHLWYVKESEWKSKYRNKFISVYKDIVSKLRNFDKQMPDNNILNYPDKDPEDWPSVEMIKYMDNFKGGPNDRSDGICTKSIVLCEFYEKDLPIFKRKSIREKLEKIIEDSIPNEFKKNNDKKMYFWISKNGNRYILIANSIIMNESAINESDNLNKPKKCTECGSTNIGVYLQGEPIYKCKECGKFLGVVPFPSKSESTNIFTSGDFDDYIEIGEERLKDIQNEAKYDPPYSEKQVKDIYGVEMYNKLIQDPAHRYRMSSGIELIYREPSKEELERIWKNWNRMSSKQKSESDKKSIELFGKSNKDHYLELISTYNESYFNENLETRLTTNPFKDTMTLYHGSDMKFDLIAPLSYNAGTKISGVRMSSFWSEDYNIAREFALYRLIESFNYFIMFKSDLSGFFVLPSQYKDIINKIKSKNIYIYEKTLSKDYIGIGHSNYFDEYTIDVPVKPDKVYIEGYSQFKHLIKNIDMLPSDNVDELKPMIKQNFKDMTKPNKLTRRVLIANDIDIMKTKIKQVRSLKKDLNESYIQEASSKNITVDYVKSIVSHISKYRGSNNCQLCAGCFEMQMRGINMIPRSVESPRDIIFENQNWTFIKNRQKIYSTKNMKKFVNNTVLKAGSGSRFYAHVGWLGSSGGHAFNIININNIVYLVDCMENIFIPLSQDKSYLVNSESDYKRCYLIKSSDSEIDRTKLRYNDKKYMRQWDDSDIEYMKSEEYLNNLDESTDMYNNESYISEACVSGSNPGNYTYYHLSKSGSIKNFDPNIPDNFMTKHGYEDSTTERVCFAPTIDKCLMALSKGLTNEEYFVYVMDDDYRIYRPSISEVPDVKITGEVWVKEPVKVKCIGKIKVVGDDGKPGKKFKYGNNKEAELFGWNYKWIDTINESYISEAKSSDSLLDFGAYHLEPKVKAKHKNKPGIWDEELYSKSIEAAIINDIKDNYECKNYNTVSAYVYTAGKNLKPIYLGTITIFDKNNPNDWEWEEQELLDKSDYNYLKKNPMVESMDISNFYDEEYYE